MTTREQRRPRDRALAAVAAGTVLLATLVAAGAAWLVSSRVVVTNYQATADVGLYPVIGSHASYDAASYTSDFIADYTSTSSGPLALGATAVPTASREGDASVVTVTLDATSRAGATDQLRSGVESALLRSARREVQRAEIEEAGARSALEEVTSADSDLPARDALRTQAATLHAEALADRESAEQVLRTVPGLADGLSISVEPLDTTMQRLKFTAAAAATAMVVALVLVWLVAARRRPVPSARPAARAERDEREDRTAER